MSNQVTVAICPHCNENAIYVFPEKELRGLSLSFHIRVTVSELYIPRIGDRNMKVGLRPLNSFSGNICFEFSVLCLCSEVGSGSGVLESIESS